MIWLRKMKTVWLLGLIIFFTIIIVLVSVKYTLSAKLLPNQWKNKHISAAPLGKYRLAAVSAMGQECASIGASILFRNGSAVDAAIATLLCEGVSSLHSMGLGGGFLMTIWDAATKKAYYLDARETAPHKANETMFEGNATLSYQGGLAVAVPGELLGYWEAHQRFGKLDWKTLFQPAIELCKEGSIINSYLAEHIKNKEHYIKKEPTLREILVDKITHQAYKEGDRIKRLTLAKTLEILSASDGSGVREFYNGSIAADLVREIQAFKGIIDIEDLQNYKVVWKDPIDVKLGNMTMYTAPPPGSGILLAFIMNVLNGFISNKEEKIVWQRIVETFKWAYARRTQLGDPEFELDVDNIIRNLTSEEYMETVRNNIGDNWTSSDPRFYGAITVNPIDSGTCHVSVLAPDGSAVSVTSTINQVFGALIRSESSGIIFNNEMDDFSSPNITNAFDLPPSPTNFIKPGKRPLSSMTPTILIDEKNEVRLVIGGAGGTKITTAVALTMILNLHAGYDIKQAVDSFRIHHQEGSF